MNKKISSLILLLVLAVTNAYLLAHPNLIGKLGILIYKHSYIKTFPRALVTVLLVIAISVLLCEALYRFAGRRVALLSYTALLFVSAGWFWYIYTTFSTLTYRITGKAFIYGAHLLPVILGGLFGRYLVKMALRRTVESQPGRVVSDEKEKPVSNDPKSAAG